MFMIRKWLLHWSMESRLSSSHVVGLADVRMRCLQTGLMDAEEKIRKLLRQRKTKPLIAKRNTENGSGLGKFRYVVEAAFDWLFNQRRLRVRYEKRDDIHQAFLIIGCFLICWRRIMEFC